MTTSPTAGPGQDGPDPASFAYPSPQTTQDPYPFYEAARAHCPVFRLEGQPAYFVSRYQDVIDTARDPGTFSSKRAPVGGGDPEYEAILAAGYVQPPTLTNNDPPAHSRIRKLVNRAFSPAAVAELEPGIRALVERLVDAFVDEGRVEFVTQFALPLPATVIADALGVSHDRFVDFKRWADDIQTLIAGFYDRERGLACSRSLVEFQQYFAAEIDRRRDDPGNDMVSRFIAARIDDERPLDVPEILELCRVVLVGGNETTSSLLTNTMYLLLQHPDQFAMVRADPSLIPALLEESLRFQSPAQWLGRVVAQDDASVGGIPTPKGSRVLLSWASANRDPVRFENPDTFDIFRTDARNHVAWGFGVHHCVGMHLARAEARIAFEVLLSRLRDIRLDPAALPISYVDSPVLRMPAALPLLFDRIA